jgi:tetratricopeptide (TPR) repeat protein
VASAALIALALSWVPPYLAARAHNQALAASGEGDPALAAERAHAAARWNPLSVDPLVTEALVLQQEGRTREARDVLLRAAMLQPDNYLVHYHLGVLELRAFGRNKAAAEALKRALALNPQDAAARFELAHALGG